MDALEAAEILEEAMDEIAGGASDPEMMEEGPITLEELEGIVKRELEDAQTWQEGFLSTERARLLNYYHGRPFGNEEDGRSQVISRDVRDTIQAMMPGLMRMFFGAQNIVEFVPKGPGDDEAARQATDYVNYIIQNDNPGFKVFYEAFKDALLLKTGIIKYWWDESLEVEAWELSGIDQIDMAVLGADPELTIEVVNMTADEMGMETYDVRLSREISNGRVKVASVPPEEFVISSRATSIEDALMVGHQSLVTVSDLVEMGYDYEMVRDHTGSDKLEYSMDRQARRIDEMVPTDRAAHESMELVFYAETYIRVDYDGDGFAELRKICVIGDSKNIVANEEVPFCPFVDLCPDPEPHTWLGTGVGDNVDDIQLIKSSVMRNVLDSLALATTPRMGVVEGMVNMDDVLNTEVGAVVRMRQPGMAFPLETPFVGQHGFSALEYMDNMRENRTGITKAAVGLDPDALQSSTRAAVAATLSSAQERTELIGRIFAEMGLVPLFRGILKLTVANQDRPRVVRLRGKWVEIDPRAWDAGMDVSVNVGFGIGDLEAKMTYLSAIADKQEQAIQAMGPQNPIAGLQEYRNTLAAMTELMGFKSPEKFFVDPAQWTPPPPEPAQPDPNMIIAQAEATKAQADAMNDANKIDLERQEALMKDDLERDKLDADIRLRAAEIEARWGAAVDVQLIKADIERERNAARQNKEGPNG